MKTDEGNKSCEKKMARSGVLHPEHQIAEMPVRCTRLNPFEFLLFQDLVLPCLKPGIARGLKAGTCALAGAYADGEPAGLAVLMHADQDAACSLASLNVKADCRNRGIGTRLLDWAAQTATGLKASVLYLDFSRQYDWSPALEHLTRKAGFETMEALIVHDISVSTPKLLNHLSYLKTVISGFRERTEKKLTISSFTDLPEKEIDRIRSGAGKWYDRGLNPFGPGGRAYQDLSLALWDDGQVKGWVDVRNLDPRSVLFNTVFIQEDLRGQGWFTRLLTESLTELSTRPEINRVFFKTRPDNQILLAAVDTLIEQYYAINRHLHVYQQKALSDLR